MQNPPITTREVIALPYTEELSYLLKVLKKMNLQAFIVPSGTMPDNGIDLGLRKTLGLNSGYETTFSCPSGWAEDKTVYKLSDEFMCNYIFMLIPEGALVIGPYQTFEIRREQLLEIAERCAMPATNFSRLEAVYAAIPLLRDKTPLLSMINVLGESLWGSSSAFHIIDIKQELTAPRGILPEQANSSEPEDFMAQMKAMEARYAYENELLENISHGLTSRAELMLNNFSMKLMDRRSPDPLRNAKIYCFICNSLMRKAAEKGGVHPVHLDAASSALARRIEVIGTVDEGSELMLEMVRSYCRLVRDSSTSHYSPFIRRCVTYIDSNIAADLSLSTLSAAQNVNASYLSTQFRREVGKTVTEYVTERRMDLAARLLLTSGLQIQTVAQHCGMSDVNYFSKLFKKQYGVTPRQYRTENRRYIP